jgi:hypothetical protein
MGAYSLAGWFETVAAVWAGGTLALIITSRFPRL